MDALSSPLFPPATRKTSQSPPPLFPRSSPRSPLLSINAVKVDDRPQIKTPKGNTSSAPTPTPSRQTITTTDNKKQGGRRGASPAPSTDATFPNVVLNALDDIINKFIDPPIRTSVDPRYVLSDNFAPVGELPPTECEVIQGSLPACLDGAYIRNGPNPQYLPRGPYHMFDGDGMLHAIKISKGKATLCSRYVKTYKYAVEREAGGPVIPNVFSGFSGLTASAARGAVTAARMLSGQFNPVNGIGLANTSLALLGGKLFALGESDLPYAVRLSMIDGDVETLGRHDFNGKLGMSMTAHPKIDQETGEAFAFRYGPVPPFLTYFRIDSKGQKQPDVPVFSMTRPSFLHDFAITKKYAVFADIQIGMNPTDMLFGGGSPVGTDSGKIPRIGIIPRYAKDESKMQWFDVPGFNLIHAINAWDEDDAVVMIAPNILSVEHTLERMDLIHAMVEKVRIDLRTGMVTRSPVSARNLDFGVVNPNWIAKKNQFVYAAIGDPMPKISGVVKLDVSLAGIKDCTVACRMFGERCYGGEPFFVAREPNNLEAKEDDGYLVSYVHDEISGESKFIVMDAQSPELDIVATVRLPARVPYGFHGIFVAEKDLLKL